MTARPKEFTSQAYTPPSLNNQRKLTSVRAFESPVSGAPSYEAKAGKPTLVKLQ
jgi:hypothetical protein